MFNADFCKNQPIHFLFDCFSSQSLQPIMTSKHSKLWNQIETLHQIFSSRSKYHKHLIQAHLTLLFIYILEKHSQKSPTNQHSRSNITETFFTILDSPKLQSRFVKYYSKQLGFSSNYLNSTLKKNTGHTAS